MKGNTLNVNGYNKYVLFVVEFPVRVLAGVKK